VRFLRPDVAITHVTWKMTGARGTESWKVPDVRHGKVTMVLVRANESQYGWQIAALQNTEVTPFPMAELDGK
jgi:hypothetical protein